MGYTKEQIRSELERRGVQVPLSKSEIRAELERRGAEVPGAEPKWLSGLQGAQHSFDKIAHGVMSPLIENKFVPEGLQNAFRGAKQRMNQSYEESLRENPGSTKVGEFLGGQTAQLPLYAVGAGLSKYIPQLPGILKNATPFLRGAVTGGVGEGAGGFLKSPEENETRLGNALEQGVPGALGGAIVGGAIPTAKEFSKLLRSAFTPAAKKSEKVMSAFRKVEKEHGDIYKNIFSQAKDAGIKIEPPKIKLDPILEHMTKKESKYLRHFLDPKSSQFGQPKAAQKAQSDLGDTIRNLTTRKGTTGLNASEREALSAAKEAQKNLRNQISEGFKKAGRSDLSKEYNDVTESFAKNVIPYRKSNAIKAFKKGERVPEDFIKELRKDKAFKAKLGEENFPELYNSEQWRDVLTKAGILGSSAYATLKR